MSSSDVLRVRELIFLVREGSDEAFGELVTMYTPMIRSVTSKYGASFDDLFSDACMALYKAAYNYDLGQSEVTFGLYAQICVAHRVLDILRRENGSSIQITEDDIDNISVDSGIVSRLIREEERRAFHQSARQLLTDLEYSVFTLWLRDLKSAEIADRLGKDVKAVENAKARLLKKLRDGLGAVKD